MCAFFFLGFANEKCRISFNLCNERQSLIEQCEKKLQQKCRGRERKTFTIKCGSCASWQLKWIYVWIMNFMRAQKKNGLSTLPSNRQTHAGNSINQCKCTEVKLKHWVKLCGKQYKCKCKWLNACTIFNRINRLHIHQTRLPHYTHCWLSACIFSSLYHTTLSRMFVSIVLVNCNLVR